MKYLFKLLWLLIVVIYTLFEVILTFMYYILYTLWHLRFPKNVWSKFHNQGGYYNMTKKDNTILDTIKRRYNTNFYMYEEEE